MVGFGESLGCDNTLCMIGLRLFTLNTLRSGFEKYLFRYFTGSCCISSRVGNGSYSVDSGGISW